MPAAGRTECEVWQFNLWDRHSGRSHRFRTFRAVLILQRANPFHALLLHWLGCGLQGEVEFDFGETTTDTVFGGPGLIITEMNLGNQLIAGGVGEIVMQVFVARQVDLRGQVAMVRRRNEEVNMRRTLAMTPQLIEQLLGRTVWRATVARRYDAAKAITALSISDDPAPQVELRLAAIEVRISAPRIGLPDVNDSARQRNAVGVGDLALHEQRHAGVGAVIQPRFVVGQRCTRHVQRPFDGARCAAGFASLLIGGVHQQVEVMLKAQSRYQQTGFLTAAQFIEVIDRLPELFRGHFQVFDDVDRILENAMYQRFGAGVAAFGKQPAGLFEEFLRIGGVGNSDTHGSNLIVISIY